MNLRLYVEEHPDVILDRLYKATKKHLAKYHNGLFLTMFKTYHGFSVNNQDSTNAFFVDYSVTVFSDGLHANLSDTKRKYVIDVVRDAPVEGNVIYVKNYKELRSMFLAAIDCEVL
jgi:hypothetical protein